MRRPSRPSRHGAGAARGRLLCVFVDGINLKRGQGGSYKNVIRVVGHMATLYTCTYNSRANEHALVFRDASKRGGACATNRIALLSASSSRQCGVCHIINLAVAVWGDL